MTERALATPPLKFGFTLSTRECDIEELYEQPSYDVGIEPNEESERIDDVVKAEVMAYAAKYYEDMAAMHRHLGHEALGALSLPREEFLAGLPENYNKKKAPYEGFYYVKKANKHAQKALEATRKAAEMYGDVEAVYDGIEISKHLRTQIVEE